MGTDKGCSPGSQSSYQVHTGLYAQEGFSNSTENMDRALNAIEQMVAEHDPLPRNASAPTWSYDQSVAQNWVPLDLADRV
jgi:hypothetical protein